MADQIVQSIVDWISVVPPLGVYLIFFGIAYVENLVPPMPGDVIVAFGGYLAAEGLIQIFPIWSLTVISSVAGFMTMYWLGHRWGGQIEENRDSHFLLRFIDYKYFARGKKWMEKWGQGVVVLNRFLAGTRSVISLTAGISHLKVIPTILSSLVSSILWNSLLLGMGWVIRDNWPVIGEYLSNYGKVILALIVLFVGGKAYFSYRRKKSNVKDEKE
ncbi:MAG: DedA family protein [Balneola sp.]|jgi:membrane protein DedA with SNARE-associated domain|nr:DedA family protein [Balneola sp.]MBE78195.1 DedA family protein [Balneola sp.]|tara:strand:- start:507 stop:1154 length:648 start_codon:yes stop_codon:yes gene_type:complete